MTRLSNPFPSAPRIQANWSDSVEFSPGKLSPGKLSPGKLGNLSHRLPQRLPLALLRRFTHPIALGLCLLSFPPTALQAAPVTSPQPEASTPVAAPSSPAQPSVPASVPPKPTPSPVTAPTGATPAVIPPSVTKPSVTTPKVIAPTSTAPTSTALTGTPDKPPSDPASTPRSPLPTPATPAPATPASTTVTPQADPIQIVLRLGKRRVYVYQGKTELASYPVAVGRTGWETPKGNFKVMHMLKNPAWQHPWNGQIIPAGPDNPLGDRWVAFWSDGKNYIGFHGTPNEELVGQAVSHGCVRMKNKDIRAMFEKVSVGTVVRVE